MANRPKQRGTKYESDVARYLRDALGDDEISRCSLHGSRDEGDIRWVRTPSGARGIMECKSYKRYGAADLAAWREQTMAERGNADADFALLAVHGYGTGITTDACWMTFGDLMVVSGWVRARDDDEREAMDETWVSMRMSELCGLIRRGMGGTG